MDSHQASIIGGRQRQEDASALRVRQDGSGALLVVADGLGGHEGGNVASALAVEGFTRAFEAPGRLPMPDRLRGALRASQAALATRIAQDPTLEDMGTTLVAAVLSPKSLRWISVGDSLLLLLRDGKLRRMNDDHSYRPMLDFLVRTGNITEEEALRHPGRHSLQCCLDGCRPPKKVDCPKRGTPLLPGDRIVVASDGLETLTHEEIAALVGRQRSAADCVGALITAVQAKGNPTQDNTTVQVAIVD